MMMCMNQLQLLNGLLNGVIKTQRSDFYVDYRLIEQADQRIALKRSTQIKVDILHASA